MKLVQTDKNKQSGRVINATAMLSVMNYMCHCFLVSAKECKRLNICEHVYPAVTVTSETAVCSWHHWQGVCLCACLCVCSHMLTALSAHCSQTACHRPRARCILQLWCHHCETELSVFASVSSPSRSQTHSHTHSQMSHSHDLTTGLSHSYFIMPSHSLWSQTNTWWLIDCRWQAIFKPHSGLWGLMRLAKDTQTNSQRQKGRVKHIIMQTSRQKLSVFTWERDNV